MGSCSRFLLAAVLIASVTLLFPLAHGQKTREPLTEGDVMQLLQGGVATQRVGKLAQEFGIAFEVSRAAERNLRSAGADDQLLQILRELGPGKGPANPKNETPKTGAPAATGILLITTDAACKLAVDGEDAGELAAGASKRLTLPFGEHLVRAVSNDEPTASVEWAGKVEKPEQALVRLVLAEKVAAIKSKPLPASATPTQAEVVIWKSIENSTRVEDFRAYIQKYPDGAFSTLALARVEKLEADAMAKETEDKNKREEEERQAEIRKYTFPVVHHHRSVLTRCWGHLQLTADGAIYRGSEHNVTFSKTNVVYIDERSGAACLRFHLMDGTNWCFLLVDEEDVRDQKLRTFYGPSSLGNRVVEKWGFISADNGKRLLPPNQGGTGQPPRSLRR